MCNVAYVQMAQVAVGAYGQNQQASAVRKNALQAQQDALYGLHDQQVQIDAQATDQMTDRSKAAMSEVGTLNAIFADSGVSGNTQDRIAAVAGINASADMATLDRNRVNKQNQTQADAASIRARTQSQINGSPRASVLGTGLQIAAIGANEYNRQNPPKKS